MLSFNDKLRQCASDNNSLLCVGLDIDLALAPPFVTATAESIFAFNQAIIEATSDLVCAYKPNLAFYEALGLIGIEALLQTLKAMPRQIPVIGDAKRSDVGHTARAYAQAMFDFFGFDAVTVNPYLGRDAVQPFTEYRDRGVFCLCKTSNPGSNDFQNLMVRADDSNEPLYLNVARQVQQWNAYNNCGLVVGATFPEELARVRELVPEMPFLIPGVGTQGGDLEAAVKYGLNGNGELAVINSSRQILYASRGNDFGTAARAAALALRDALNNARPRGTSG